MQSFHWGKACICNPTTSIPYRQLYDNLVMIFGFQIGAAGGRGAARSRAEAARLTALPDVNKRGCRSQFQPDRSCTDPVED
ncbi:hypothetical protein Celaphus_00015128 [Cervus elaphus hippelaphus]|uniref:Uncharacterized protein n=1 Tax=Cervus elaphus hippelaphus TaxID=46360 RepID=A0A212CS95_CEREH|nr:hypothetical protein Celaphus_00015128 [Cervus elaphus hippelaphus]